MAPSRVPQCAQNNCRIMYRTVLQGRQLCLQLLQLQDRLAWWQAEGQGEGKRLANFIVMALMKMLLQSFAGLARAFYIN